MKNDIESKLNQREFRGVQVAPTEEEYIVEGYATTFNNPYVLYADSECEIREQVDSHAFDDCDMSDVIMQFDHTGKVYARTRNNTLQLSCDEHGLKVRAYLGGTDDGKSLYQAIKGGYIDRMSFGFVVTAHEVTRVDEVGAKEIVLRTITKIGKLYDVSAVSIPANDYTSISARKFSDGVIAELQTERFERAKAKLKIKLMEV